MTSVREEWGRGRGKSRIWGREEEGRGGTLRRDYERKERGERK